MSIGITSIEILDADERTVDIRIETNRGTIEIISEVRIAERRLAMVNAHIDGPGRGTVGRDGLNAIARTFMEVLDVDEIIIFGSVRSTGRNSGRRPKPIRIRR
ncbi:MAG TPA: hypothetical protein VH414_15150 [Lichenihabitans sp.]|jgi:hypothetical protein|nr:hypothetical protein [Lichenihabitans sp.]